MMYAALSLLPKPHPKGYAICDSPMGKTTDVVGGSLFILCKILTSRNIIVAMK